MVLFFKVESRAEDVKSLRVFLLKQGFDFEVIHFVPFSSKLKLSFEGKTLRLYTFENISSS